MKSALVLTILISTWAYSQSYLGQSNSVFSIPQGWTASEAQSAYHQYEGSQIIPLRWFLNLELAGSNKKLIDNASVYGLIPASLVPTDLTANPYNLPVGLTAADDLETAKLYGEKKWLGVNCTACHTGLVEIRGKKLIVEGGPSLFNIQKFEQDISNSVKSTLNDPEKFQRFSKSLKSDQPDSLKLALQKFSDEFWAWSERNHHFINPDQIEVPYGPGRVDGLGGATNDLICHLTDRLGDEALKSSVTDPSNCKTSQPPVSLQHLWGMTQEQFVQWNGAVHSSLGRNYGQATATYGKNWVEKDSVGKPQFRSTADIQGLYKLERLYNKLKSPSWSDLVNQGLAEPLYPDMVQNGKKVFVETCVACHSISPQFTFPTAFDFGNSYWKIAVVPTDVVQTESLYLEQNVGRRAVLPNALRSVYGSAADEKGQVSAAEFRAFMIGALIKKNFEINKTPLWEKAKLTNCRDNALQQTVVGYKSRSLEGVFLTAPYLHNGSVATLWDLLQPADKRAKDFYIGCRQYDLENLGYECNQNSENAEPFNTRLKGNSNQGHEFGVNLSPEHKRELIAFLKSLDQPTAAWSKNPLCN